MVIKLNFGVSFAVGCFNFAVVNYNNFYFLVTSLGKSGLGGYDQDNFVCYFSFLKASTASLSVATGVFMSMVTL